uniref:Dynein light chain n=1 Tax=Oncorhynchus mykiss TaxID=8022 RepID=A0A8C7RX08_ONCMY
MLPRFEKQDGHLAQVEVDEMLGLMGHIAAKVPPYDAMPVIDLSSGYLLDVCSDVFLDVILLQCLRGALHCVLLHLLRHVRIFYDCFSVRHGTWHPWELLFYQRCITISITATAQFLWIRF